MKSLPLSQGKTALVDDADYEALAKHKWSIGGGGGRRYAVRLERGKTLLMHRVLLGAPKGTHTDHIDGNGYNNQRANLRLCSRGENMCNRKKHKNNTNTFKGVRKSKNRWAARIQINNKPLWLGSYLSKEIAAKAYNEAALKYHGGFARLNPL